jgi:hypothetical protein
MNKHRLWKTNLTLVDFTCQWGNLSDEKLNALMFGPFFHRILSCLHFSAELLSAFKRIYIKFPQEAM